MTDTTQGADALDDHALFNEATSLATLEKFENPEPVAPEAKPEVKPEAKAEPEVKPAGESKPEAKPDDNAPVPAGRMREESEARRRAERERDDLLRRLEALTARQAPPQATQQRQTPQEIDLLENPKGFVRQEVQPMLEQLQGLFQQQREAMSLDWAVRQHGDDTVAAARQHLEQGMQRGDQGAWA